MSSIGVIVSTNFEWIESNQRRVLLITEGKQTRGSASISSKPTSAESLHRLDYWATKLYVITPVTFTASTIRNVGANFACDAAFTDT